MNAKTIKTLIHDASQTLANVSDSSNLDAEILLAHCLNKNRSYLHTWPEKEISELEYRCFGTAISRRKDDYPVAYIVGHKAFWTFELTVTPDVLIPRPETELLVETALEKIRTIKSPKVLDLGTGSGAIALAIASERKDATIIATDHSPEALNVAKNNAQQLQLDQQVSFIQSNWFTALEENEFDLIVSNPPYIDPDDPHLLLTIRHEPQSALIAENHGMSDIETIVEKCPKFLKNGGWLVLEHGFDQAMKTQSLLKESGFFAIDTLSDLNNNPRVSLAKIETSE